MKVALGTFEIDDDTRKAIRKELGGKGHATRGEVKDFLLAALNDDVLPNIGQEQEPEPEQQPQAATPISSPGEAGTLPEPGSSPTSTNTVSTAPATGNAANTSTTI